MEEWETGLEPATACREGRYLLFHCSHAATPLKMGTSRVGRLYGINQADARGREHSAIRYEA
jgi:hypothetical protein